MTGTIPALPVAGSMLGEVAQVQGLKGEPAEDIGSLVEQAASGSHGAYASLMQRHWAGVHRVVRRMLRDEDAAQDVAQQAFIRGWESIGTLRTPSRFRSWIFAIALNLGRNALRTRNRHNHVDMDNVVLAAPAVEDMGEATERRDWLRGALKDLPERQRTVVTLRIEGELSFREIADATGGTEGAARVNFCYALKTLKRRMNEIGAHDEAC